MTSPSTGVAADLDLLLADLRELVEIESPSSDPTAVAASAEAVARVGERLLGSELPLTGAFGGAGA